MRGLSSLIFVLATAAALLLQVVRCGLPGSSVLPLERAFPVSRRLGLDELRARDRVRHARMLQKLMVGGVVDFSVQGSSDLFLVGLYYTKVRLGSPPREFNVQIDTGSDILWVTCNSCANCPQSSGLGIPLNFYDAGSSSTAYLVPCSDSMCSNSFETTATQCLPHSNQCTYSFQYGDGSGTSGYYVFDTMYFDTILGQSLIANSSAQIVFGCSTYQSGDLAKSEKAIDGIFGFGPGELSVISQLSSKAITPKVFSHCLRGDGKGGGVLVLGEILEPGIVYSPLVPSQAHYSLNLQSISVNGQLLPIDSMAFSTSTNQGAIIDSGTTLAYLLQEAYDPLVSSVTAAVSQSVTPIISKGNQCYLVSTSLSDVFPLVSLNFAGGASMVLKPEEYLMHLGFVDGTAMWCIGFQKAQDEGYTILGDLVLKDKIFVYDLARQRIGWASYDCSLSVNVSVTSGKEEYMNAGQVNASKSSRNMLVMMLCIGIMTLTVHILIWTGF